MIFIKRTVRNIKGIKGDGRTVRTTQNTLMGFLSQFVILVLSFVSRTVFIRALGNEYLGLNSIFSDVLTLLSMADLGFGTAMAYTFYKPLAEGDETRIAALTNFYRKVYRVIAASVLGVGLAITPFLRLVINTEKPIPHLEIYYLFALANVVVSYLFVYKTSVLNADQKNYIVTRISICTSVLRTLAQITVLLLFGNYILYLATSVAFQFLNNYLASRRASKEYPYIGKKEQLPEAERKSIFANIRSVFIYKVSGTLFSAVDNILISVIISTTMVGLYSNYFLISSKLLLIIQIIFSALTASVGNLVAKESPQKKFEVFTAVQSVSSILCGILTSLFFLLANDFIILWLGKSYTLSFSVVLAVTVNTYFSCILQPLWVFRDATGLYMKTKYIMLLGALVNLGLSIALGYGFGLAGIIFASAIARLCTYFWYEPRLLFREYFGKPAGSYYLTILANALLVALCAGGLYIAFSGFLVNTWLRLILKAAICGAVCGVLFFLVYIRTPGGKMILEKARQLLRRG